ncbi:unnamed protein product [Peniophora sp. CBMAI 1063]|nr:unnamed protein product [Peniophora sp. CBMAI 1063]
MPKEATQTKTRKAAAKKTDGKKTRAKKDKNAPKRGLSAYMFFSQDHREQVKKDHPDASFGELGKILGGKWKEMDDDDKKPYIKQAAEDKARYEREKEEYESGKAASGSGEEAEDDD